MIATGPEQVIAAEQGHADVQRNLGVIYANGEEQLRAMSMRLCSQTSLLQMERKQAANTGILLQNR